MPVLKRSSDDLGWWLTPMWALRWYASGHRFAREHLDKNRLTAIPHGLRVVRCAYRWATGKNGASDA